VENHKKKISNPRVLSAPPPLMGFPLELGIGDWDKKTRMVGYWTEKEV